ncbi:ty3-gypsy retrotransposon protein [Tanacetum coccineum]
MTALQADLQVTKGLIQAWHNDGGGETASLIPRSMRLGVPKFLRTDPDRDAAEWFRWMSRNKLITDWEGFLESVRNRFGPCKYEDPRGALSKLLQFGTVAQYQSDFEKLMHRVTEIPEKLLISFYISGLKPSLQRELLVSKPTTLGDAFSLARIIVSLVSNMAIVNSGGGQNQKDNPELVKPALSATPPKPTSNSNEDANADQDNPEDQGDALESGDISILNSLVGNGSPRSLQLWGTIGSGNIHVLIDNGSTHNFVQPGVVERMKLAVSITKPFKVYIGSGETLLCENICSKVGINMQGLAVEVDLYVLPRKGPDVVLGIQWLQKLGKVTHDYVEQTMEFILEGVTHTLWDPGIKINFFRHHLEDKVVFEAVVSYVGDQEDLDVKDKQVKKADDREIENIKDKEGKNVEDQQGSEKDDDTNNDDVGYMRQPIKDES